MTCSDAAATCCKAAAHPPIGLSPACCWHSKADAPSHPRQLTLQQRVQLCWADADGKHLLQRALQLVLPVQLIIWLGQRLHRRQRVLSCIVLSALPRQEHIVEALPQHKRPSRVARLQAQRARLGTLLLQGLQQHRDPVWHAKSRRAAECLKGLLMPPSASMPLLSFLCMSAHCSSSDTIESSAQPAAGLQPLQAQPCS